MFMFLLPCTDAQKDHIPSQVLAGWAVERSGSCRLIASFIISTWSETATTSYETLATFRHFADFMN